MSYRLAVVTLCLMVFLVEVLLDPSTPFVRSSFDPNVGKLVMNVAPMSDLSETLAGQQHSQKSAPKQQSNEVITFDNAATHAGQVSLPFRVTVLFQVTRHFPSPHSPYQEFYPSSPQRPPSV